MKKHILSIVLLLINVLYVSSCFISDDKDMLSWQYIENDGEFLRIDVEGVIYTQNSDTLWEPPITKGVTEIGEGLFIFDEDIDRMFVLVWEDQHEKVGAKSFVRESNDLPEFEYENVDKLEFYVFYASDKLYSTTEDTKAIEKIFTEMQEIKQMDKSFYNENMQNDRFSRVGDIIFCNNELIGIEVRRSIYAIADMYVMFLQGSDKYAEISNELMSDLIGIDMPKAEIYTLLDDAEIAVLFDNLVQ